MSMAWFVLLLLAFYVASLFGKGRFAAFTPDKTQPLRGILAVLIVAHHLSHIAPADAVLTPVYSWSASLVSLFFFISGFGLTRQLASRGAKLPVRLLRPPYRAGHPCVMAAGLRAVPPFRWKPGMEPGRRRLGALGHGKRHLALLMVRALHPLSVRRLLPVRPLRARAVDGAGAGRVDPGRDDSRRAGRLGAVLVFVRFGFPRRSFLRPSRGVTFGLLPAPSMVLPSGRARIAPRGRSILPVEEGVGQCSLFRSPAAHGGGAPHAGGY